MTTTSAPFAPAVEVPPRWEEAAVAPDGFFPGPPPLTAAARRFLLALALLFLAAVAACLNGSSVALWTAGSFLDIHPREVRPGLLLSTPKVQRADEWNVWTPAMLNQARQEPPFPVHNATLGPGATPLLMSLPARHYTMAFRPALWGFFFLPFDYAFSWYWNAKVFGLGAAVFLLGWTLTGGRFGWSVFTAVAVQFSPFVQWWFSTPAMLPEMIACWSLGLVAALALFAPGGGRRGRVLAAGAVAFCAVGFVLCCYPAFEIPLAHVGLCVLAGSLWQTRRWSWRGAAWLAGALLAA
ncbi:MAG: hypothetical protein INR65_17050, partial [Gluconacetobacter diazotrophicus]|nr:hypothetical protein [Gluconacetobacter diazotrophicus]